MEENKMNLDLEYKRAVPKATDKPEEARTQPELTRDYIGFAVNASHEKGLDGQLRRIFARIQRKLDDAIESGVNYISLEEAEKDLLRKSVEKCNVPAHLSKYFVVFEDEIERVTSRKSA